MIGTKILLAIAFLCVNVRSGSADSAPANPLDKFSEETSRIWSFLGQGLGCLFNGELFNNGSIVAVAEEACTNIICQVVSGSYSQLSKSNLKLFPLENCQCRLHPKRKFGLPSLSGFKKALKKTLKKVSKKFDLAKKANLNTEEGCYFNGRLVLAGGIADSAPSGCAQLKCEKAVLDGPSELSIFVNRECSCSVIAAPTKITQIPTAGMMPDDTMTGMMTDDTTTGMMTDDTTTRTMTDDTTGTMTDDTTTGTMTDDTTTGMMTDDTTAGLVTDDTTGTMTDDTTTGMMTDGITTQKMTDFTPPNPATTDAATTPTPCSRYAQFFQSHTMCLPPNPRCSVRKSGISAAEKDVILKSHNFIRALMATGVAEAGSEGTLPQSSNMKELTWNQELADIALAWSRQCPSDQDCYNCRVPVTTTYSITGQNIYKTYGIQGSDDHDVASLLGNIVKWEDAVSAWNNESIHVDVGVIRAFRPSVKGKVVGHFSQLVWAETGEVGCGSTTYGPCTDQSGTGLFTQCQVFVCNYGPAGNYVGHPVYAEGAPATMCKNGRSTLFGGLCNP